MDSTRGRRSSRVCLGEERPLTSEGSRVDARCRADHGRPGMADTLCHLADARDAGAMCALGVTNYNAEQLYAACALGTGVATNQVREQ